MVAAYRDQWPRMHGKTVETLSAVTLKLGSFYPGDVRDYLRDVVPPDGPFASFPPFWAAGYEVRFRGIETHFDWPEPAYENLDEDGKQEIIDLVTGRRDWLLGLHYLDPGLEEHRVGFAQMTPRAVPIWVYASGRHSRVAGPHQPTAPVLMPKISRDEDLGGKLTLHPLTGPQFNGLRSQFLDTRIAPGTPMLACAVACDGALIGAFAYLPPSLDPLACYLMSDFPIGWSKYKRLSKLIVLAATSREAQALLQRMRSRRVTKWATTAFTDNPTSGKYGRGIPGVKLTSRKPCEQSNHKWQLQYEGTIGEWTLAEALTMWRAKHAAHLR
jgi:hypothetical protein